MLCSDSQQPDHLVRSWAGIPKYFFVFISLGGSRVPGWRGIYRGESAVPEGQNWNLVSLAGTFCPPNLTLQSG